MMAKEKASNYGSGSGRRRSRPWEHLGSLISNTYEVESFPKKSIETLSIFPKQKKSLIVRNNSRSNDDGTLSEEQIIPISRSPSSLPGCETSSVRSPTPSNPTAYVFHDGMRSTMSRTKTERDRNFSGDDKNNNNSNNDDDDLDADHTGGSGTNKRPPKLCYLSRTKYSRMHSGVTTTTATNSSCRTVEADNPVAPSRSSVRDVVESLQTLTDERDFQDHLSLCSSGAVTYLDEEVERINTSAANNKNNVDVVHVVNGNDRDCTRANAGIVDDGNEPINGDDDVARHPKQQQQQQQQQQQRPLNPMATVFLFIGEEQKYLSNNEVAKERGGFYVSVRRAPPISPMSDVTISPIFEQQQRQLTENADATSDERELKRYFVLKDDTRSALSIPDLDDFDHQHLMDEERELDQRTSRGVAAAAHRDDSE